MISRLSESLPAQLSTELSPLETPHRESVSYESTLTSLKVSSLYSWIPGLVNQVWWMIKSLFFCYRYPTHHNTAFDPEIDPSIIGSSDPFYRVVFASNKKLKNDRAYKLVCKLFDILGEGGVYHWSVNLGTINQLKEDILEHDIHPLESLYVLFHNREIAKLACHFIDNAPFWIKGRFLKEHALEFKGTNKPIKPLVSGYCKLMLLDETHVQKLVNAKKWQELIQYSYETRKKHFNL